MSTVDALDRLMAAARKITESNGYYPTHLGGCIGGLSSTKCECGITDLSYAVRGYDNALRDAAIALGDIQPPEPLISPPDAESARPPVVDLMKALEDSLARAKTVGDHG